MKEFLAVDFGTTQTSVALLKEGSKHAPDVIQINDGQKTEKAIATALQVDDDNNITYFGRQALEKAEEAPANTFQNFKVFIGKKDMRYQLKTEQTKYSPDDLALLFLGKLRETIEEHYFNGCKLSEIPELSCIIGCPSDFNGEQKRTLKDIAVNAGFPNPKLCDEAIGVIYFNHFFGNLKLNQDPYQSKIKDILVYDFGGGTTDVAIARVIISNDGKIKPSILSVKGISDLGGRNFDEAIAAHYMKENNYDLKSLLVKKDRLHDQWVINLAARQAKEDLSSKRYVEQIINRLKVVNNQRPNKLSISREQFHKICSGFIGKFDRPIYDALSSAELSEQDIDAVILAGGSSAMPYVSEAMKKIFSSPKTEILISSDTEVVAQGLATYARVEALGLSAKKDIPVTNRKDAATMPLDVNTAKSDNKTTSSKPSNGLKKVTSTIAGSSITGAVMGSFIPGVGTAVGAMIGAGIGLGVHVADQMSAASERATWEAAEKAKAGSKALLEKRRKRREAAEETAINEAINIRLNKLAESKEESKEM